MNWQPHERLMYRELESSSLEDLLLRFNGPSPDGPRYGQAYYDDVALAIRRYGEPGITFLKHELPRTDAAHAASILLALSWSPEIHDAHDLLVAHLSDRRPMVVMRAVDGLTALGAKEVRDRIITLRHHRSPYVRGAVLRYMGRQYPEDSLPVLLDALKDPHYLVRESAVDMLDELEAADALPALQPLTRDPHPHVRQAVETALNNMRGSPT